MLLLFVFVGTYHRYDTLIYPRLERAMPRASLKEMIVKRLINVKEAAKGWWHGAASDEQEHDGTAETMNIPDKSATLSNDALRTKCLQYYLSDYIAVLHLGSLPQSIRMDEFVDCICHIYGCIENLVLHNGRKYSEPSTWRWGNARDVGCILF